MNYYEALNYIHSLLVFGSVPGLERIGALLDALGNPQDKLKFIHIAGTNGKGSASTMLAEVYRQAGLKTGLYTSPYIVDFRERIQINNEYISKEDLAEFCKTVKDTNITVTEFEFITALAFLYFERKQCDIVILETGLGGRFDATNIIKSPLCSVIMKIDYDHTAILGDSLKQIAMEKCGIIKDSPTVCYPLQEVKAFDTIKEYANSLCVPDTGKLQIISSSVEGNFFVYKGREYTTRLLGKHQIYNALTVIEAVNSAGIPASYETVRKAVAEANLPARLELVSKKPVIFLDGAHNPNGAEAVSGFMKNYGGDVVAVIGMMADKNCDEFLRKTLKYCASVVTVTVKENTRSISAEDLAQIAAKYCSDITVASDYDSAIGSALKKTEGKKPLFVFGSLYLAGAIREKLFSL